MLVAEGDAAVWDQYWEVVGAAAVPKELAEELAKALARLRPRMLHPVGNDAGAAGGT